MKKASKVVHVFLLISCSCSTLPIGPKIDTRTVPCGTIEESLYHMGVGIMDIRDDPEYHPVPVRLFHKFAPPPPLVVDSFDCDDVATVSLSKAILHYRGQPTSPAYFKISFIDSRVSPPIAHEANVAFGTDRYFHYVDFSLNQTMKLSVLLQQIDKSTVYISR